VGSLIRHLPRDSHFVTATYGRDAAWGLAEQLLATAVDVLQLQVWQLGGDKNVPKPQPIPRPGVAGGGRRYKAHRSYPVSEMRKILDEW
jgi:hypothetical protein